MDATPYPIAGIPYERATGGGGISVFDTPEALAINRARMTHLQQLELPLSDTSVLDVGCGVGHLARFFVERGCKVTCVDGRPENITELKKRLPLVEGHVCDVQTDRLTQFGRFPVVLCYGLLYHLENPAAALRNIAEVCDGILLLETVISDHELPVVRILDEPPLTANQALGGLGCRPTPAFVAMAATRAGFGYIYAPKVPPDHPDFHFEWRNNLDCARDEHLLRCVFVASRHPLDNPHLKLLVAAPEHTGTGFTPLAAARRERVWLDVGSHLGEKTFSAAERDPALRVYAFEPNLAVAGKVIGKLPNFVVLPMAVAENDGAADFYVNECDAASSLLPFEPEGLNTWIGREQLHVRETRTVPAIRLDTFLNQAGIERVEFLKIDAQGADLAVIRSCGARLKDVERIELEVQITEIPLYRNSASKKDVVEFLYNAGFDLESSEPQSMGQEENLRFVRSFFADVATAVSQARPLSCALPLNVSPGWHFGAGWDRADALTQKKRAIWRYFAKRAMGTPLEFDWYNGTSLLLYMGNDVSRALFVEGCLDPNEFVFLDGFLKAGMTVADVGANEGLYALFAAGKVTDSGRVLAFEPSTREFERLTINIQRNHFSNIEANPFALGTSDSEAVLHVATQEHAGQNTLGAFAYDGVEILRDERVIMRTLDSVVAERGLERLDFIKVDIEGGETALIRGARMSIRRFRPVILFEVSDASLRQSSSSRDELIQTIASLGYDFYVFDSDSGLPRRAAQSEFTENMLAAPVERPLPAELCAAQRADAAAVRFHVVEPGLMPFSLHHYAVCEIASLIGSDPLRILTAAQQWSYALLLPVLEPQRERIAGNAAIKLQVDILVHTGRIGVGVVAADLKTYLTTEVEIQSSGECITLDLMTFALPPGSALVVRNTSPEGRPSEATLSSLRVLSPDEDAL